MMSNILNYINGVNNSSKLIGFCLVSVFIISLLVFQSLSIKELNAAITREEELLKQDNQRLLHVQNIKNNFSKSQQKLYSLEAQVPNSPLEESILSSLQETAEISQMDFTKVTFGKTTVGEGFTQLGMTITYTGNFYNLLNLFDKVKSGARLVRFDSVNINKDKNKNLLKAEIQASAFYSSAAVPAPTPSKK